ncbi:MAG: hypothetical protein J5842_02925 [Lachnospiraceae bacterium]|nr:hypothetical protein [Lachnospiraceae bacterium]
MVSDKGCVMEKKGTGLKLLMPSAAVILTLIHIALVHGRDKVTFQWPEPWTFRVMCIVTVFVAFVFCFYLKTIHFVISLFQKKDGYLYRAKLFAGYFLFMSIFWILTWPGIFKGDEFYTIRAALSFELSAMQSGLTSMFYIITLLFFPSMASIVFFQLLIICIIFSVVMGDILKAFEGKKRLFFFLPFILFPVIDGNLFTLRASLVGWLFLLLLDRLVMLAAYKKDESGQLERAKEYLIITALSGLICAWRSEFIYLIVAVPMLLFFRRKVMGIRIWQSCLCMLMIIVFWQVFCVPNKIAANGQNKYPISLVLNPVANLFTEVEDLRGPDVSGDVFTINEVVDAAQLRKDASVRNISQYWNIPDVLPKDQLSRFMKASIRLIVYNPVKFLKYRWQTFAYTNGIYDDGHTNFPGGEDPNALPYLTYYDFNFGEFFVFSRPMLGYALREKTIMLLGCRMKTETGTKGNIMMPVMYNVIPVVILLLISLGLMIRYKKHTLTGVIVLLFLQFPLVFLTAPAMFFMYYFCLYLCGYCMIVISLSVAAKERAEKKSKRSGQDFDDKIRKKETQTL